jgi:hypothetical protein
MSDLRGVSGMWRTVGGGLGAVVLTALVIGIGACGSDDGDTSSAALKERLPAADDLGLKPERKFEWDNATDFVVQGVPYSEGTKPSELIDAIEEAGFSGGAGAVLADHRRMSHLRILVAEFDSDDGALEARDRMHAEHLKQPCLAACTVTPTEYEVEDIPNSVSVHHAPTEGKPPHGLFKFEGYLLEFTIGSRLYIAAADGPPGSTTSDDFDELAKTVYREATAAS